MASAKIKQKIPMNEFKNVGSQLKAEGVHVISLGAFKRGKVEPRDIQGRVISACNLGAKIVVDATTGNNIEDSRLEKLNGVYYLVVK